LETSLLGYLLEFIDTADTNKDGKIDFEEWKNLGKLSFANLGTRHLTCTPAKLIKKKVPMSTKHLDKIKDIFHQYDIDSDESLTFNELTALLVDLGNKITSLPAVCACTRPYEHDSRLHIHHRLLKLRLSKANILAVNYQTGPSSAK
jgi:hypothetical protein